MRDGANNLTGLNALTIQSITTDTTTGGAEIDRGSKIGESLTFFVHAGTITDGTFTPVIQHSDTSGSGFTDVADSDLIGTEAGAAIVAADDNKVTKIGYVGAKRYVKINIVSTGTSSGGTLSAMALIGHLLVNPDTVQKN